MIDPVSAQRSQAVQALHQQPSGPEPADLAPVATEDRLRFEAALNGPQTVEEAKPVEVAQLSGDDPWVIHPNDPADAAPPVPTVGERILDGMTSFRDAWGEAQNVIQQIGERTKDVSPTEMLAIQFQVSHSTIMLTMVGQEVGTLSQKIDGLLKTG